MHRQCGVSAWIWLALIAAIGIVFAFVGGGGQVSMPGSSTTPQLSPRAQALKALKLTKMDWKKSGFGNVMIVDLTVENASGLPVKDIELECTLSGNSGTRIGSISKKIYERFDPGTRKTIKGFNMGLIDRQSEGATCEIVDAIPAV